MALAPRPNSLTGLDGEARLSRQLYSVVADYTFAAPDAWVVPRLAIDLGALHATTRGLVNAESRDQWAFTSGAHAGLAAAAIVIRTKLIRFVSQEWQIRDHRG